MRPSPPGARGAWTAWEGTVSARSSLRGKQGAPPRYIGTRALGPTAPRVSTPVPPGCHFVARPPFRAARGAGAGRGPAMGVAGGGRAPGPFVLRPGSRGPSGSAASSARRVNGETQRRGVRDPGAHWKRGASPCRDDVLRGEPWAAAVGRSCGRAWHPEPPQTKSCAAGGLQRPGEANKGAEAASSRAPGGGARAAHEVEGL